MLGDTIHGVASPPGGSARGILRVSGPAALATAGALMGQTLAERAVVAGAAMVAGFAVPCTAVVMPGPRSYTGEDVVELHLIGSPLLLSTVQAQLEQHDGVRAALPGEFTRRAFENGRLTLSQAEAVLDLVHAETDDERQRALAAVDGAVTGAVDRVRRGIQDAMALLESGLDFGSEETGAVPVSAWRPGLDVAAADLAQLSAQLPPSHAAGALALCGRSNAGKSSLINALLGRDEVVVADERGTTRDVLRVAVAGAIELLDGPGDLEESGDFDGPGIDDPGIREPGRSGAGDLSQGTAPLDPDDVRALQLRDRLLAEAAGYVLVVDAGDRRPPVLSAALPRRPVVATVITKIDTVEPHMLKAAPWRDVPQPVFFVDNVRGEGHGPLLEFLRGRSAGSRSGRGERLRSALGRARDGLARAIAAADAGLPEEMVALDLRTALECLDEIDGRSSPEDLLDRIFGRFCLGK